MHDKLKIRVQLAHKFDFAHRPLHTKVIKRFLILPVGSSFQNQDLAKPSAMKSQPYLPVLRRPRHDPEYMARPLRVPPRSTSPPRHARSAISTICGTATIRYSPFSMIGPCIFTWSSHWLWRWVGRLYGVSWRSSASLSASSRASPLPPSRRGYSPRPPPHSSHPPHQHWDNKPPGGASSYRSTHRHYDQPPWRYDPLG